MTNQPNDPDVATINRIVHSARTQLERTLDLGPDWAEDNGEFLAEVVMDVVGDLNAAVELLDALELLVARKTTAGKEPAAEKGKKS
jgi:hypothetical protein